MPRLLSQKEKRKKRKKEKKIKELTKAKGNNRAAFKKLLNGRKCESRQGYYDPASYPLSTKAVENIEKFCI